MDNDIAGINTILQSVHPDLPLYVDPCAVGGKIGGPIGGKIGGPISQIKYAAALKAAEVSCHITIMICCTLTDCMLIRLVEQLKGNRHW